MKMTNLKKMFKNMCNRTNFICTIVIWKNKNRKKKREAEVDEDNEK